MKGNCTTYSVAWFEENSRVNGSQTDQGEVLDDGCHMTSTSRPLCSKGHVITRLIIVCFSEWKDDKIERKTDNCVFLVKE